MNKNLKRVLLLFAAAGLVLNACGKKKAKLAEISPKRGDIAIELKLNGSVEPRNRVEVKPQISGRLEEVLVTEGMKVKKGDVIAVMSSTDRAALLDAARSKGPEELAKWEKAYNPAPVVSPLTGFVILRNKEPGQSVTTQDIIAVISDELIVKANVDETDLRYIAVGRQADIELDSYPGKRFPGVIEHVAYDSTVINNVTVYEVKIRPLKPPENFRSGMTATIDFTAEKNENVLLLPVDAVKTRGGRSVVMLKTGGKKPELRRVETGITDGRNIEIKSGVEETDTVLASGNYAEKTGGGQPERVMRGPGSLFGVGTKKRN
ncbi:MAG: efflux RND transporter periplasmic adaptor subunit [Endomicrobiales bacterium]|nr:efflux RND transporter periplasmic adaptor subunit [Endomicrobiales bacterium]